MPTLRQTYPKEYAKIRSYLSLIRAMPLGNAEILAMLRLNFGASVVDEHKRDILILVKNLKRKRPSSPKDALRGPLACHCGGKFTCHAKYLKHLAGCLPLMVTASDGLPPNSRDQRDLDLNHICDGCSQDTFGGKLKCDSGQRVNSEPALLPVEADERSLPGKQVGMDSSLKISATPTDKHQIETNEMEIKSQFDQRIPNFPIKILQKAISSTTRGDFLEYSDTLRQELLAHYSSQARDLLQIESTSCQDQPLRLRNAILVILKREIDCIKTGQNCCPNKNLIYPHACLGRSFKTRAWSSAILKQCTYECALNPSSKQQLLLLRQLQREVIHFRKYPASQFRIPNHGQIAGVSPQGKRARKLVAKALKMANRLKAQAKKAHSEGTVASEVEEEKIDSLEEALEEWELKFKEEEYETKELDAIYAQAFSKYVSSYLPSEDLKRVAVSSCSDQARRQVETIVVATKNARNAIDELARQIKDKNGPQVLRCAKDIFDLLKPDWQQILKHLKRRCMSSLISRNLPDGQAFKVDFSSTLKDIPIHLTKKDVTAQAHVSGEWRQNTGRHLERNIACLSETTRTINTILGYLKKMQGLIDSIEASPLADGQKGALEMNTLNTLGQLYSLQSKSEHGEKRKTKIVGYATLPPMMRQRKYRRPYSLVSRRLNSQKELLAEWLEVATIIERASSVTKCTLREAAGKTDVIKIQELLHNETVLNIPLVSRVMGGGKQFADERLDDSAYIVEGDLINTVVYDQARLDRNGSASSRDGECLPEETVQVYNGMSQQESPVNLKEGELEMHTISTMFGAQQCEPSN